MCKPLHAIEVCSILTSARPYVVGLLFAIDIFGRDRCTNQGQQSHIDIQTSRQEGQEVSGSPPLGKDQVPRVGGTSRHSNSNGLSLLHTCEHETRSR
ncbi:hypothetical protein PISMIDRAFT_671810 [Pisolithus microcarpus 441]|uniref:Uncharacterized protein n=1 Tax=Pisolithus microcarpus 441 TaxID=765257 RepID=A0A0D0A5X5_9AGAM|nr:hypothetical protein PISMIDRAFT_671810 [Pisolithus microcarpus 441]